MTPFFWDSEEVYHFDRYNLALKPEFIQKAISTPVCIIEHPDIAGMFREEMTYQEALEVFLQFFEGKPEDIARIRAAFHRFIPAEWKER